MLDEFKCYLRSRTNLSDDHLNQICTAASPRMLRRNDYVLSEGEICRHKTFIVKGMLHTFATSVDGNEPILQFSLENSWTLDAESYDTQSPSKYNIAAVEESEVLMWHKPDFDKLLSDVPPLKAFAEQLISRSGYSIRTRLLSALSASPEERYNDFVRDYPTLLTRLPLRMIAAYLGISIKTLTRIRHAQAHGLQ